MRVFALCLVLLTACGSTDVVTLSSDRPTARANGADAVTVTATVKNAGGVVQSGVAVFFSAPSGMISRLSANTDAFGKATTTITSATAQTIAVKASLDAASMGVTTTVTFTSSNALRFSTSPRNTVAGDLLRPVPVVAIEDAMGGATTSAATVTVRITAGSCAAALDASSLTSVVAQNGSASFYGLKSSTAATGCTLTATSDGAIAGVSTAFDIQ